MSALNAFVSRLNAADFAFSETLEFISAHYHYQPQAFRNGNVENTQGQNEGSCKTLGLALLEQLTDQQALLCFGEHYRSVLATPEGNDHSNIRALMTQGLAAVHFSQLPLTRRI